MGRDHAEIRRLGDHHAGQRSQPPPRLHEPEGAGAIGLFTAGGGKDEVALQLGPRINELADRGHRRSDATLHIDRTPPVNPAVLFFRTEGSVPPRFFSRPDHVEMAHEQ